ncbi:MAG: phosphoglycerate kinase, partial [Candidatus Heimdallarchaeota archaeon]|nr:phosphoglycerate kinase [Candidatus Heimdallarchaeota archaeon]
MFTKKTIKDLDFKGKKVLVRVDFNVPLENGEIADDTRIVAALPTIEYLLTQNAAVILASHLGRPGGEYKLEFSLKQVADYLGNIVDVPVHFVDQCTGDKAARAAEKLNNGEILLLENTRFNPGEKENDPDLGKSLAALAEIFVNDAFGTAHRAHASNVGVAKHMPAVAGLLLEKEINYLGNAIADPRRPFTAILGGAKVSDKIGVIRNLIDKVDHILIGGGMANTFFAAQGYAIGDSLFENEAIDIALELLNSAGPKLLLPCDVVIADKFNKNANYRTIKIGNVPEGWRIMDIGTDSLADFKGIVEKSKTIVWNGPMGVFEFPHFAGGTIGIC